MIELLAGLMYKLAYGCLWWHLCLRYMVVYKSGFKKKKKKVPLAPERAQARSFHLWESGRKQQSLHQTERAGKGPGPHAVLGGCLMELGRTTVGVAVA